MVQTINNKVRRAFSESAKGYDLYSGLHRKIADRLFSQVIKGAVPAALLDVGCGTGYLTVMLKEYFPEAQVTGLDFAQGMLEVARSKHEGITWVLGDGNDLAFSDGSFNVLASNLAYQWVEDLTRAFREARRVLAADGLLSCTLFGYNTCRELFQSLDEAKNHALRFTRLPDESRVREALINSGFKDPKISVEQIKIEFKNMRELMAWLKSIGANNLPREGSLGRGDISMAADIYQNKFPYLQGVGATFEVIRVYVKK